MKAAVLALLSLAACIDRPLVTPTVDRVPEVDCPPGENVCYAAKIVAQQNCEHKNICAAGGTGTSEPLDECVARYVAGICSVADCSAPYENWDRLAECTAALPEAGCAKECFP